MTEAFVAFVRHEEKLLLLKRNGSAEHFPDLWDGVWGVADLSLIHISEAHET